MSEKAKEVQKFYNTMYTQSLPGETIYEYFQCPEYEDRLRSASFGTYLVFSDITS